MAIKTDRNYCRKILYCRFKVDDSNQLYCITISQYHLFLLTKLLPSFSLSLSLFRYPLEPSGWLIKPDKTYWPEKGGTGEGCRGEIYTRIYGRHTVLENGKQCYICPLSDQSIWSFSIDSIEQVFKKRSYKKHIQDQSFSIYFTFIYIYIYIY